MKEKQLDAYAMGSRVKQYRKAKQYSADRLGDEAKISKSHVNNIETGNSRASAEVLVRIANALDVTVDLLVCDSLTAKAAQKARIAECEKILSGCNRRQEEIILETMRELKKTLQKADV